MTTSPATEDRSQRSLAAEEQTAQREYLFFRKLTITALVLSSAIALSLNLVDPDLWGHVRYGQELLATGELPRTATHTYTAEGYRWINHENLAELLLAVGAAHLGPTGMLVVKCLWGVNLLILMVWVAVRQGVSRLTAWAWMLLIANNLTAFFPLRPQLLSFTWFSLLMVVLHLAFERRNESREAGGSGDVLSPPAPAPNSAWLWLAVPIFAVWANSHGGFLAGLGVFSVYLGGKGIELLWRSRLQAWPTVAHWTLIGVAAIAATLATPYGLDLWRWLAVSLGQPRPEITEWAAPKPSDPVFVPLIALLAGTILCLAASRRRRDWTQIVILALVAWQAFSHLRHIAFFALLCGFWLPVHVQSALSRLRGPEQDGLPAIRFSPRLRQVVTVCLLAALGFLSIGLFRRVTDLPVYRDKYPVDAVQFMADHKVGGRLVVSFHWAQYAIAALAPDVKVAFDGRFRTCYPQQVVDMQFDFLLGEHKGLRFRSPASGPIDEHKILRHCDPELVLIDRNFKECIAVMRAEAERAEPDWVLLYQDGLAQLWGRQQIFANPESPRYLSPLDRQIGEELPEDSVPWPAMPERRRHFKFVGPPQSGSDAQVKETSYESTTPAI